MRNIRDFILKDVQNENESSKPAVILRLTAISMIAYCLFLSAGVFKSGDFQMLAFVIPYMAMSIYIFAQTYYNHVKSAAYLLNILTIGWIILVILQYGWDLGVQHFIFLLLLFDFFLPYWNIKIKIVFMVVSCILRITLFFYCKFNTPHFSIPTEVGYYYQVVNTICIFSMIGILGCLLSTDFLTMEEKLTETNKKLRYQAETDPLTQLMNRLCMISYAEGKMKKWESESGMSVAIGDIDFFKKFNDTYGHECGDAVLTTLSKLFREIMEPYGAVARWGGEEFLFFFEKGNGDEAYIILRDLTDKIKKLDITYGERKLKVSMTFGLVEISKNSVFDDNIREADHLLYYGKEHGRDQIVY